MTQTEEHEYTILPDSLTEELKRADKNMVLHISAQRVDKDYDLFEMFASADPSKLLGALMTIFKTFVYSEDARQMYDNPVQAFVEAWREEVLEAHREKNGYRDIDPGIMLFTGEDTTNILDNALADSCPEVRDMIFSLEEENQNLKTTIENLKYALSVYQEKNK